VKVGLGDGRVVEAVGVGTIQFNMLFKVSDNNRAATYDVLHITKLSCNLFSLRAGGKQSNLVNQGAGSEVPNFFLHVKHWNCVDWGNSSAQSSDI